MQLGIRLHDTTKLPFEERMETEVDEWLKELLMGPSGLRLPELLKEDPEALRAFQEEVFGPEETAVWKQKEELLCFLNRMTDFIGEAFGEDVELTDWLRGIRGHGDWGLTGFSRPEMDRLLNRKEQEERLRKSIKEMEGMYEAVDRK